MPGMAVERIPITSRVSRPRCPISPGDRFGMLRADYASDGANWSCLCDCGRIIIVRARSLWSFNTRSCGCLRKIKRTNPVGQIYGRLTVIAEADPVLRSDGSRDRCCICRCTCGTENIVRLAALRRGNTKSCGCFAKEQSSKRNGRHRESHLTAEYTAWVSMKGRCENPNNKDWDHYGGRGIKVCARWRNSYETFLADMGRKPSTELSLDRHPDNDGDYEPDNCRWATWPQQQRNKRRSR
jgi:hypothetical protein